MLSIRAFNACLKLPCEHAPNPTSPCRSPTCGSADAGRALLLCRVSARQGHACARACWLESTAKCWCVHACRLVRTTPPLGWSGSRPLDRHTLPAGVTCNKPVANPSVTHSSRAGLQGVHCRQPALRLLCCLRVSERLLPPAPHPLAGPRARCSSPTACAAWTTALCSTPACACGWCATWTFTSPSPSASQVRVTQAVHCVVFVLLDAGIG